MKGWLTLAGGALGAWRRGLGGMVLGAGAGWALGALLEPRKGTPSLPDVEHYLRYPEEEMVDALMDAGGQVEAEAAELDDLYREVTGKG